MVSMATPALVGGGRIDSHTPPVTSSRSALWVASGSYYGKEGGQFCPP